MDTITFTKQVPVALIALGAHIAEHQLANPIAIDISAEKREVLVRVAGEADQRAWLNTLIIEGEENEAWMGPIWIKTTWSVRLPDTGIGFELRGLRQAPGRILSAVPA